MKILKDKSKETIREKMRLNFTREELEIMWKVRMKIREQYKFYPFHNVFKKPKPKPIRL